MIKKITIILIIIGFLAIGVFAVLKWQKAREEKLMLSFLATEQLKDDYNSAINAEEKMKNSEILAPYISAGFYWKILADNTGEKLFYKKAVNAYLDAIEKFGMGYYIPYANLAGVYQSLGDFEKAEGMLKKALLIVPGESPLYIRLVELYRYDMNKSPEEILAVYDNGMGRVLSTLALVVSKANYLKDIGRKQESLELFEATYETTGNALFKREIKRLRQELGMVDIN
ncbi:MAG: tetratricopeptide repeat protein [Patescibacteria group bacterium]|nr:tetratricopeptide repeat protein [Patescibacteria group bacterium]